ncbi:NADH-quinone oxidoreductase subunit C [Streptomyces marokkonensis]|uniref:NADH-quinone oxidoreductase subunit C n=1 Tax=Streptomyces marokkonensis TaxID=324855 RepID=A0ABW6Q3A7_9ACTN
MTAVGWLPAGAEELFGAEATAEESYGVLTVDVPPASWIDALRAARDRVGCTFFDWLSAVDEPGTGFRVTAHVAALAPVRRLLLRTTVPHEAPTLPSAVDVYAGAAWHERETHEMFGVDFTGHPGLDHLLLPDTFEGHPLRKDFVLAARVAKAWPGAKEPGEPAAGAAHGGPKRRQMLPPGVPDPNDWGPLKGQLPPAPARPARGAGRPAAAGARTPGDRPPRRTRTASEGSASQAATTEPSAQSPASPRRTRTAAEGSASQAAGPEAPARRARSASEGSASQRSDTPAAGGPRRARTASEGSASRRAAADGAAAAGEEAAPTEGGPDHRPPAAPRSPDAPWHHARPAFTEPEPERNSQPGAAPQSVTGTEPEAGPPTEREPESGPGTGTQGGSPTEREGEREPEAGSPSEREAGRPEREPEAGSPTEREAGTEPQGRPPTERGAEPGADPDRDSVAEPEPGTDGGSRAAADTRPGTGGGDPETTTPEDPSGGPR